MVETTRAENVSYLHDIPNTENVSDLHDIPDKRLDSIVRAQRVNRHHGGRPASF